MVNKQILTERQQLIRGFERRIKFRTKKLNETKKFHREVEKEQAKKIKLDAMQLRALKKSK